MTFTSRTESGATEAGSNTLGPRVFLLSLLMAFGPMSTDMYLPSMPALGRAFGASSAEVQMTLSTFLLGFGIAQLLWGPLGDRFGRRWPMVAGILLHLVGSTGCTLAGSIDAMIVWRFVQALGACAPLVLARAMVRDLFSGAQAARMLSILMLVAGIAPLLAPIVGGQVLVLAGWRAIFGVQMGFGVVALAGIFLLGETLPPARRPLIRAREMALNYLDIARDRRFLGYMLCGAFFYGAIFAYLAGTPFVYITFFGLPAQYYGLLFGLNIAGMMGMNVLNSRMVVRYGADLMLRIGCLVSAAMTLVLLATSVTGFGGIYGIAGPIFVFISMIGFVTANAMAGALSAFPQKAGTASAFAGGAQFAFGSVSGAAIGWFYTGTPVAMAAIMAFCGVFTAIANLFFVRRIDAA